MAATMLKSPPLALRRVFFAKEGRMLFVYRMTGQVNHLNSQCSGYARRARHFEAAAEQSRTTLSDFMRRSGRRRRNRHVLPRRHQYRPKTGKRSSMDNRPR